MRIDAVAYRPVGKRRPRCAKRRARELRRRGHPLGNRERAAMRTYLSCVVVAVVSAGLFACGGGSGPSGAAPAQQSGAAARRRQRSGHHARRGRRPGGGGSSGGQRRSEPDLPGLPARDGPAPEQRRPVLTKPGHRRHHVEQRPVGRGLHQVRRRVGATSYWTAASSEYGVGPAVSGAANHVSMTTAPPATMTETQQDTTSDFIKMVAANAGTTARRDRPDHLRVLPPAGHEPAHGPGRAAAPPTPAAPASAATTSRRRSAPDQTRTRSCRAARSAAATRPRSRRRCR